MKRIAAATLGAAALLLPAVPAHAAPGASGYTCALDARDDPSGTIAQPSVFWGTMQGGPVTGSDQTNQSNVVSVSVECRIVVNGVVVNAMWASGTPTASTSGNVAYVATPTDVVEVCTIWTVSDSATTKTYHWDAPSAAFTTGAATCEPVVVGSFFGFWTTHTVQSQSTSV